MLNYDATVEEQISESWHPSDYSNLPKYLTSAYLTCSTVRPVCRDVCWWPMTCALSFPYFVPPNRVQNLKSRTDTCFRLYRLLLRHLAEIYARLIYYSSFYSASPFLRVSGLVSVCSVFLVSPCFTLNKEWICTIFLIVVKNDRSYWTREIRRWEDERLDWPRTWRERPFGDMT